MRSRGDISRSFGCLTAFGVLACILSLLLLTPLTASAQQRRVASGWTVYAIDGSYSFIGQRRDVSNTFRTGENSRNALTSLSGELNGTIKSYIRHPGVASIDFDIGLNPGFRNESFLRIPARKQAKTAENIGVRAYLFRSFPVSFQGSASFSHRYAFRDFVNNVEGRRFGTSEILSLNSKLVKANISHRWSDWEQSELQSDRQYNNREQIVSAVIRKDTKRYGTHHLNLKYEDTYRERRPIYTIRQIVRDLRIYDRIDWKTPGRNFWRSEVRVKSLRGTTRLNRSQVTETIRFDLPLSFSLGGTYDHYKVTAEETANTVNSVSGTLSHQLYNSLHSQIDVEYSNSEESVLTESWLAYGFSLAYEKRLPVGRLAVTWSNRFRNQDQKKKNENILVVDEEHRIDDRKILLLDHPDVDVGTIVVSGADRIVLFEEGIDYVIIDADPYIELRRLLGGQILEGTRIRVDYVARPMEFIFDEKDRGFSVNYFSPKNLVRLYYRSRDRSYDNVQAAANDVLITADQSIVGGQISYRFISAGAEKDISKSNIAPYRTDRVFGSFSHSFSSRLRGTLSGNYRSMLLTANDERRTYSNVIATVQFRLGVLGLISVDGGYQVDRGPGIDLDLRRIGFEFSHDQQASRLTLSVVFFDRTFLSDELVYTDIRLRYRKMF